jgi:uncharacterized protein
MSPVKGRLLDLSQLVFPELEAPRRALLEALTTLCTQDMEQARMSLGLTQGQTEEIRRNQGLWTAPTAPAWQVYTGVLYSQLDAESLTRAQRKKLEESVWIASALFGFVGFADSIPAYRLSGDASLPGVGALTRLWQELLTARLAEETGLILDLRSGSYVKLGPLPACVADRAVVARVLQKMPSGPPKLVTHFNKATKGRIVRAIAQHRRALQTPREMAELLARQVGEVTLAKPLKAGQPHQLEIVVDQVT